MKKRNNQMVDLLKSVVELNKGTEEEYMNAQINWLIEKLRVAELPWWKRALHYWFGWF